MRKAKIVKHDNTRLPAYNTQLNDTSHEHSDQIELAELLIEDLNIQLEKEKDE